MGEEMAYFHSNCIRCPIFGKDYSANAHSSPNCASGFGRAHHRMTDDIDFFGEIGYYQGVGRVLSVNPLLTCKDCRGAQLSGHPSHELMRTGRGQPPRSLRLPLRSPISSVLRVRLRSLALATTRPLGKGSWPCGLPAPPFHRPRTRLYSCDF